MLQRGDADPHRITNVATTKASWARANLSLGRLQMRYSASKGDLWQIFLRAIRNRTIRTASVPILLTLLSFMAITWALSTIFIVDLQSVQPPLFSGTFWQPMDANIQYEMAHIRLSSTMPNVDDTCAKSVLSGNCTFDLAIAPLSSLLITRQPYSIAGIGFDIDQSTRGVPYDAMFDFWNDPAVSRFNELTGYYCLPVLVEKTVSCQRDLTTPGFTMNGSLCSLKLATDFMSSRWTPAPSMLDRTQGLLVGMERLQS